MKAATKAVILSLAAPAALLAFAPGGASNPEPSPSAEAIERAVAVAEARSDQAGARPACSAAAKEEQAR